TVHLQKVVDPLNSGLWQELGSEDSTQRGYRGLPLHQFLSSITDSSTMDTYCPPHRTLLLGKGWGCPRAEGCGIYSDRRKETEENICPRPEPGESLSITHRDYSARGFQPTPLPTTQPHNYLTEQPTSFWLEQARGLPGVTAIFGRNIPFKRNTAFSTPITVYLGQPCDPPSSELQPY
ncbi:SPAG8 protein, partial [Grallaria varia]|nr:SPAG8 protein [Grallaria varia]